MFGVVNEVFAGTVHFYIEECCSCHILFGMDKRTRQRYLDSGASFYCPNGHSQHYTESTVKKLEKQLALANKRTEWAQQDAKSAKDRAKHEEKRARTYLGHFNRVKKRVAAGVCPCCNRTFKQLAEHMASKHPTYQGEGK